MKLYLEVYLDVIFLINFIVDFILLLIVKKIMKCSSHLFRIILGAAVGAIGSCILAVATGLNGFIQFLLSYVIISGIMVWITYRPSKWSVAIKSILILYVATFFLGGILNSLYYHSMLGYYFHELLQGRLVQNLSGSQILFYIFSGIIAIIILIKVMNSLRKGDLEIYEADLFLDKKSIRVSGLLDTGNCLYDPIFGKPVIIIEYSALTSLLSEEQTGIIEKWIDTSQGSFDYQKTEMLKNFSVMMIPYRSIGKKNGMLPAIKLNKVIVYKGEEKICNEQVLTGIWRGKLSKNKEYQLILHRNLV